MVAPRIWTRQAVLNGGLLLSVLLISFAPLLGVNPAALSAVHAHFYFGHPEYADNHAHHVHLHTGIPSDGHNMTPLELMERLDEAIALLPD